jgi:hypothetical protein
MQTRNRIFTLTMPFAIIRSQENEFSGEAICRLCGVHHPGKPAGFNVKRILGKGDLWITEYTITYQGRPAYTVSIMAFRNGKVVHETQYFADPFEAPASRPRCIAVRSFRSSIARIVGGAITQSVARHDQSVRIGLVDEPRRRAPLPPEALVTPTPPWTPSRPRQMMRTTHD